MNKTKTIAFYVGGKKPCIEVLVSIYTLRKFYRGPIAVAIGETAVPYLQQLIDSKDIDTIIVPNTSTDRTRKNHWVSRWKGLKLIDYDKVLHLDCDTIIVNPIDHLFSCIHPDKEYITNFDVLCRKKDSKWNLHLRSFRRIFPDFNTDKPIYIEFGLVGWNKGWPYFDLVSSFSVKTRNDQESMALVLIQNGHKAYKPPFKYDAISKMKGYHRMPLEKRNNLIVMHLVVPEGFAFFWKYFLEARKNRFMGLHDNSYIEKVRPDLLKTLMNKNWPNIILGYSEKGFGKDVPILEKIPQKE